MENKKFQINYQIVYIGGTLSIEKQMKVSNCMSELHAKVKLEDYLKRKYNNFARLIVHSCIEDKLDKIFGDGSSDFLGKKSSNFSQMFNDIFNIKK
jgi:hypothetical protein